MSVDAIIGVGVNLLEGEAQPIINVVSGESHDLLKAQLGVRYLSPAPVTDYVTYQQRLQIFREAAAQGRLDEPLGTDN